MVKATDPAEWPELSPRWKCAVECKCDRPSCIERRALRTVIPSKPVVSDTNHSKPRNRLALNRNIKKHETVPKQETQRKVQKDAETVGIVPTEPTTSPAPGLATKGQTLSTAADPGQKISKRLRPVGSQEADPDSDHTTPDLSQCSLSLSQEEVAFADNSRERALYRLGRGRQPVLNSCNTEKVVLEIRTAGDFEGDPDTVQHIEVGSQYEGDLAGIKDMFNRARDNHYKTPKFDESDEAREARKESKRLKLMPDRDADRLETGKYAEDKPRQQSSRTHKYVLDAAEGEDDSSDENSSEDDDDLEEKRKMQNFINDEASSDDEGSEHRGASAR